MAEQQEIKMDYELMQEMQKTFEQGAAQLQDVLAVVQDIAGKLEDGALQGQAGQALAGAVRGELAQAIQKLKDKFEEEQADLQNAVQQMQQAEQTAKGMYN